MRTNPDHSHWHEPPILPRNTPTLAPALDQPLSTPPRSSPDRLSNRDPEITSDDLHRLAGSASGTGRSSGSLLDEAAATLDWSPEHQLPRSRATEGGRTAVPRAHRACARTRGRRARARRGGASGRRSSVAASSAGKRRNAVGPSGTRRRSPRRPSRPVKVDVDPEAWEAVKRDGVRRRRPVGAVVGELVRLAVQDGVVPRNRPRRKSAQGPAGPQQTQQSSAQSDCAAALCKGRIFARLFVDEETWAQFRVLAFDAHVPIGRLVGLLVEREARNIKNRENR